LANTTASAIQNPGETQSTADSNAAQIADAHAATAFLAALVAQGDQTQGLVIAKASSAEAAIGNAANDWSANTVVPGAVRRTAAGTHAITHRESIRSDVPPGTIVNIGVDLVTQNYFGAAMSMFNVFGGLFGDSGGSDNNAEHVEHRH